ncbi:tubulin polyglutamylase TTLL13 isoform X2 [Plutella xylostella]|uniref:tubulin polyglutamylase TTLL13 isoform X2 n=1 Tax=Plutella xylostella TaxID=51655 RepID=UPI002032B494|nr:tubulin polyglutamylase TTLL13 isoform X2 [Plutella xylostella]
MDTSSACLGEDDDVSITYVAKTLMKNAATKKKIEKALEEQQARDERTAAENIAQIMRQYENKLYGEDDTSQPNSRVGPAMPVEPVRKKKKKRRSQITICLVNCRYESIRKVAGAFGMREVPEDEAWNFYWTDMSVSVERAKEMKRFQRINHFPGMLEICRKDLLARNLNRMQKIYPKEYNFFPKTWCLPADFGEALNYSKIRKNKTFIIKPECGSQGRGIYLTKSLKDVKPTEKLICQVYVAKPYLVDGYKFDMRVYTLITSCDPLRIFVYNEGLVRFATSRYADPSANNTTNVFMHLTNYAVNKHSRTYVHDSEAGSKRKISTLNKILQSQGVNVEALWQSVDQVIVKTIISAWPILKHSYHACFPTHDMVHACFEILGFDILLDHKLHPFILEVNHSPSFHTDTQLDREVKEALLSDTLSMLNIWQCDRRRALLEDRRRIRDRLTGHSEAAEDREVETSPWQTQITWEETHLGNYRRVYPAGDQYAALFQQPAGSLYTATASSRARGDCTRIQKEEFLQTKEKAEALKKPSQPQPKVERKKLSVEESVANTTVTSVTGVTSVTEKSCRSKARERRREREEREKRLAEIPSKITVTPPEPATARKPAPVFRSFEPDPILRVEESERRNQLAQRDFLIRSYGVLEQIYLVMKKTGTLRPEDERKYGVYGRLSAAEPRPKKQIKFNVRSDAKIHPVRGRPACRGVPEEYGLRVLSSDLLPLPPAPAAAPPRSTRAQVVRRAYTNWKMHTFLPEIKLK